MYWLITAPYHSTDLNMLSYNYTLLVKGITIASRIS